MIKEYIVIELVDHCYFI